VIDESDDFTGHVVFAQVREHLLGQQLTAGLSRRRGQRAHEGKSA
jgi:hypothetical protein